MRKRSKVQAGPKQEDLPWVRVITRDDEDINIFSKKTSHWFEGNRRHLQTKLLTNGQLFNFFKLANISLSHDSRKIISHQRLAIENSTKKISRNLKITNKNINTFAAHYNNPFSIINKNWNIKHKEHRDIDIYSKYRRYKNKFYNYRYFSSTKAKNFCLYLGRGRTYNRKLFISRHAIRKLTQVGLISGIQKS